MRYAQLFTSIFCALFAVPAFAQTVEKRASPDEARAAAIDIGDAAVARGDHVNACSSYRYAYQLRASGGLAHDRADCQNKGRSRRRSYRDGRLMRSEH